MYRQALWMKHYGHMCLKRTLLWSTSAAIACMDLGPVVKGQHKSLVKTAQKYQDKSGRTRYKGTGSALKGTQFLDCISRHFHHLPVDGDFRHFFLLEVFGDNMGQVVY